MAGWAAPILREVGKAIVGDIAGEFAKDAVQFVRREFVEHEDSYPRQLLEGYHARRRIEYSRARLTWEMNEIRERMAMEMEAARFQFELENPSSAPVITTGYPMPVRRERFEWFPEWSVQTKVLRAIFDR